MYQHENTAFTHTSNSQPPSRPNLYITTDEAEDLIDKVSATLLTQHRTAQQWVNEKKNQITSAMFLDLLLETLNNW